jgi:hypothetical protein
MNSNKTFLGISLSPIVTYAILGFIYYKYGFKAFAIAVVIYLGVSKPVADISTPTNPTNPTNPNQPTNPEVIGGNTGIIFRGSVTDGIAPGGTSFVEFLKNIPYPNVGGEYFTDRFPDIVPPMFVDPVTGREIPTMIFAMNCCVMPFKRQGVDPFKKGINVDLSVDRYTNGVEITGLYGQYPIPMNQFDSPIKFYNRGTAVGWGLGPGESFDNKTGEDIWQLGSAVASHTYFGTQNGAGYGMVLEIDLENGYAEGSNQKQIDGAINLFEGACYNAKGYVSSPYSAVFDTLGYLNGKLYPDKTGNFPNAPKNRVFWGTCQSGPATGKSATAGTISQKMIWGSEISHTNEESMWEEGEAMLSPSGQTLRVVNRFGANPTHEHYLARELCINETQAYACEKFGYRWGGYTKSVCDRSGPLGNGWNYDDTQKYLDNQNRVFGTIHIGREKLFKATITKAMVGTFLQTKWDRNDFPNNSTSKLDSYHGWLAAIAELNFIKEFSDGDKVSFTELFPGLKFLRWDTPIKFNGGIDTRIKATDVQESKDVCVVRGAVDNVRGYYVGWATKAYKVENVNSVTFEYENDNWILEPVTVQLTTEKDWSFDIYKMTKKV